MDIFFKTIVSLQVSPSTLNTKKKTQYLMQAAPQAAVMGTVQGSRPSSMMSPMDAVKSCLKGSLSFDGRASRSEYWWFYLFFVIVYALLTTIAGAAGVSALTMAIILLVPASLGAAVRRMHDIGKSGWMMLLMIIPLVGFVLVIMWFVVDAGQPEANQYGNVPTNMAE
jgi:uncharacterized membrane protein YhaH (DUF805 family)